MNSDLLYVIYMLGKRDVTELMQTDMPLWKSYSMLRFLEEDVEIQLWKMLTYRVYNRLCNNLLELLLGSNKKSKHMKI